MKFLIRQKIFSIGEKFTIKDEQDKDCYQVKGAIFTLAKKLELLDMQEQTLISIRQKLFAFMPEYFLLKGEEQVARIKQKFAFLKPKFEITGVNGTYSMEGNFLAYDFTLVKEGTVAATVSKKFFSFTDSYGVEVAQGEDPAFILALVIVIDQVIHPTR